MAATLAALAANCFLKYLWWTACYSAYYGIPKMAEQWRAAGSRATFNCWSFILLEVASVGVIFSLISFSRSELSRFLKNGVRLFLALTMAIFATAIFALALSWLKQDIH